MVKLIDIARKAQVSVATVSLALRNQGKVSPVTVERVQRLAREMGYQPNPLVSAYQANVRSGRQQCFRGTIAWIDDTRPGTYQNRSAANLQMQKGAQEQAAAQGFALDVICVPDINPYDDDGNRLRLERIMAARGIAGVIFPQLWWARMLTYEWSSVAVAAYGGNAGFVEKFDKFGFGSLRYTHVVADVYNDTRLALAHLRGKGYRRIALITCNHHEIGASYRFTAARHAFSSEHVDIPLIKSWVDGKTLVEKVPVGFKEWLRTVRPDAVLTTLGCARDWLSACGLKAPGDIGLAHPFLGPGEENWSGVREDYPLVGRTLMDSVTAQILRGERGVPAYPKCILTSGKWEQGCTTRIIADPQD